MIDSRPCTEEDLVRLAGMNAPVSLMLDMRVGGTRIKTVLGGQLYHCKRDGYWMLESHHHQGPSVHIVPGPELLLLYHCVLSLTLP